MAKMLNCSMCGAKINADTGETFYTKESKANQIDKLQERIKQLEAEIMTLKITVKTETETETEKDEDFWQ